MATTKVAKAGSIGQRKKGKNKQSYTMTEKARAIEKLVLNGMNYKMTTKEVGCSHIALRGWVSDYPELVSKFEQGAFNKYNVLRMESSVNLMKKSKNIIDLALNRAVELIENEKNLDKISNFIKAITPLANAIHEEDNYQEGTRVINVTLKKLHSIDEQDVPFEEIDGEDDSLSTPSLD